MENPDMMTLIAQEPWWLSSWVYWLIAINSLSLFFAFTRNEAHWVLTAWLGNLVMMPMLFEAVGYVRLLGLTHIVFWTPLVVYLWRQRSEFGSSWSGRYLWVVLATNSASLIIDYIDVVRYLLGDGDLA
ncbi:MAG: hypothetical protein Q8K13_11665 [Parvibaculum sp.]|uniref:hypothetical protein n=1 Tax=Parvibaculum sp. TaxID=2024848 RepID=UPI0027321BAE|nr:hypothetical protein [Parvibaculum sp.]MDP2150288.1 hypothetical protein [Parvibaculum sp.]